MFERIKAYLAEVKRKRKLAMEQYKAQIAAENGKEEWKEPIDETETPTDPNIEEQEEESELPEEFLE